MYLPDGVEYPGVCEPLPDGVQAGVVGWLDAEHAFNVGIVWDDFVARLVEACRVRDRRRRTSTSKHGRRCGSEFGLLTRSSNSGTAHAQSATSPCTSMTAGQRGSGTSPLGWRAFRNHA